MDNLLFCLNATVPVFMLIVLGFFFRKIHLFDDPFVSQANKFVFTIALPVLVFQDMAVTDFVPSRDSVYVLFCFGTTFLCIGLAVLFSLFFRKKYSQGEFIQASYRSSAALLGIALIQNIYGDTGMVSLMILGAVPLYNITAVVVLEFFKPNQRVFQKNLVRDAGKGILTNPILISFFFGILWSVFHLPMPTILDKTLGYISNLATPPWTYGHGSLL